MASSNAVTKNKYRHLGHWERVSRPYGFFNSPLQSKASISQPQIHPPAPLRTHSRFIPRTNRHFAQKSILLFKNTHCKPVPPCRDFIRLAPKNITPHSYSSGAQGVFKYVCKVRASGRSYDTPPGTSYRIKQKAFAFDEQAKSFFQIARFSAAVLIILSTIS